MTGLLSRFLATRDRGLVVVALVFLACALGLGLAVLYSIPLGLGDKKFVTLLGWTGERRATYQAAFTLAGGNLLLLIAALALPGRIARGLLRPVFAALNVTVITLLMVRSEALLDQKKAESTGAAAYTTLPPAPFDGPAHAAALIRATDRAAAETVRDRLTERIFNGPLPGDRLFETVERDVTEARLADLGAARIDRFSLPLPYGYGATAYHLTPSAEPSGTLVLYNHGHVSDIFGEEAREAIGRLLAAGHGVTALSMPHRAPNLSPDYLETARHGVLPNTLDHEGLSYLETEEFSPIRLFIEPLVVAVTQGIADGYRTIAATGISGGGWSITVAAAVDPRITASYPVAGSLPIYLLTLPPNRPGDWEQVHADIYRIASYPDLYVLGAEGEGRRHIQILNQYDSCCFRGIGARSYAPAVSEAAAALGGRYELRILSEHDHRIAPEAFDLMLKDLAAGAP